MQASVSKVTVNVSKLCRRNIGVFAPCLQKGSEPIQQLFLDVLKDYKAKSAGGKLISPSPEMEKELQNDRERVYRQYGEAVGSDLTKFPTISFKDVPLESAE